MLKKISLYVLVIFFIVAGLNHFIHPEFYYPLIPSYLPFQPLINVISGLVELLIAVGWTIRGLRKYSSWTGIAMLVAFIPSHVYFIEIGSCVDGGLCVPVWVAWLRLIVVHPLLILWIWWHRK